MFCHRQRDPASRCCIVLGPCSLRFRLGRASAAVGFAVNVVPLPASAIGIRADPTTVKQVITKLAFVAVATGPREDPATVPFAVAEVAFVVGAIGPRANSVAV